MDPKNEDVGAEVEETLDLPADPAEGEEDTTDWKAEAQKLRDKAISQRERTKSLKKELADTKKAVEVVAGSAKVQSQPKTGELDETTLDYLDLKGISEAEDLSIIQRHVLRTGETVRQALKDDYVQAKLKANQDNREVKAATPSSTKRSGSGQTNDLAIALAKYEQSGMKDLPTDFELRRQVVNAMEAKTSSNKPSWH